MKKYLFFLLTTLVAAACSDTGKQQSKAPVRVLTEVVSPAAATATPTALGPQAGAQTYVGIVEEREATAVSFTGMGVVRRVLVSEGQAVGRGQLIAEMDDTQARNLLSGAEAQMAQANDALERFRMLHDNGSLPEVQWVEIQSKVAQAKSQLDVARKNLADCRLTAPVAGIVGKKLVGAGETALPSQAVVTILDIGSVKVKVAMPETEIAAISANTPTYIKVEATGQSYRGGRIEKGISADALTHTYDVRISVANGERRLLPGMVASVSFDKPQPLEGSAAPMVPVTAVQRTSDGKMFVWTVAPDSTARRQTVTVGTTQGNRIAVTTGVDSGARIVTEGYQKLSEGTKVVY